jgi:hypothetical protein
MMYVDVGLRLNGEGFPKNNRRGRGIYEGKTVTGELFTKGN